MTKRSIKGVANARVSIDEIALRGERAIAANRPLNVYSASIPEVTATELGDAAVLRAGQEVRVSRLEGNSVVVKSPRLLKPGLRTDLELTTRGRVLRGAFENCRISQLAPLCYEATFVFDQSVEMSEANHV